MKTLYLLRHAKSSWEDAGLDDYHRPLSPRGEKDAPKMGKRLRREGILPNLICSSSAARAIATARLAAEEMNYPVKTIQQEKKLYHAGPEEILGFLRSLPPSLESVMLVGHNPGLTEFANDLLNEEIDNIPTAGVIGAKLSVDSWKEVKWGCGKMFLYDYPKKE
ncbi:MAG: histidine phosphatase family protein [Cyclobacteriaceae bacterium]|nr:histidine phosphatase family protein [Cyclobacteriaceae bacterium]